MTAPGIGCSRNSRKRLMHDFLRSCESPRRRTRTRECRTDSWMCRAGTVTYVPERTRRHGRAQISVSIEMPFRKRATGSGFQVPFKCNRMSFVREFDRNIQFPWSTFCGVRATAAVMPGKALFGITGQTDIVPVRVEETLQGVDEALFHALGRCNGTANDELLA